MAWPKPEDLRYSDCALVLLAFYAPVGVVVIDVSTASGKIAYAAPIALLAIVAIVLLVFDRRGDRERYERQLKAANDDADDRRDEAADLRATLGRSEILQARMHEHLERLAAAEDLRQAGGVSADADTTLAKVQALQLSDEINALLAEYYRNVKGGVTTEAELLSDFEMLYSYAVLKTRSDLAARGKTDVLLDRFAHKQEDAESIATTAQVIHHLADQLPEADTFPTGVARNDGSTALERYQDYIDRILEQAKIVAAEAAAARQRPHTRVEIARLTVHAPDGLIGDEPLVLAALTMRNPGATGLAHKWTLLLTPDRAIGKQPEPFRQVAVKEIYDPGDYRQWKPDEHIFLDSIVEVPNNELPQRFFLGKVTGVPSVTKEMLHGVRMEFQDSTESTRYSNYVEGNVHLGKLLLPGVYAVSV